MEFLPPSTWWYLLSLNRETLQQYSQDTTKDRTTIDQISPIVPTHGQTIQHLLRDPYVLIQNRRRGRTRRTVSTQQAVLCVLYQSRYAVWHQQGSSGQRTRYTVSVDAPCSRQGNAKAA
ncbi:Os04g0426700 [Oryza sativa Japonica Group]|uniref:Os04g0426700 protein n=1 Tax=Oryza sativa subsp. japonica TaxID=39947 RepID=A0A0P0WAM3_ORYSJ|nr:Os04g0426700 [Oryza sativa Japonica Group]